MLYIIIMYICIILNQDFMFLLCKYRTYTTWYFHAIKRFTLNLCPLPVFSNESGRSATWLRRYICYVKSLV